MVDYSYALRNALLYKDVFKKPYIIIHCFFHFIQAIVKKLKELKIIQKMMIKKNIYLNIFIKYGFQKIIIYIIIMNYSKIII